MLLRRLPVTLQATCQPPRIDRRRRRTKVNAPAAGAREPSPGSRNGTLVSRAGTWQCAAMANPSPSPSAGGLPIAIGAIGGPAVGFAFGQATPGFLIGLTLGIVVALLIWWRGR